MKNLSQDDIEKATGLVLPYVSRVENGHTVPSVDHVVPQANLGRISYRNLVSRCLECNSQETEKSAEEFLRWLHRERRPHLRRTCRGPRALDALAAGKLRPVIATFDSPIARKGRSPLQPMAS